MAPSDSDFPAEIDLADAFGAEVDDAPADERVYRAALQLYDPTRVADVADRASCASDTARRHLERLTDIGVLDRVSANPATYRRNESYFEWRTRSRLEGLSTTELQDRLAELTSRDQTFREMYGTSDPGSVDALDHVDYDKVEDVWLDLSEWRTVRRRIDRLEAVRKERAAGSTSGSEAA